VVVRAFYHRLLEQVRTIPGVKDVGMANRVPLTRGNSQRNVIAEGREPQQGEPVLVANVRVVTPEYFRAIGTPLLEGRVFDKTDDTQSPRVAVVDEAFARHF
jgi:putative ABC transport system permease protein